MILIENSAMLLTFRYRIKDRTSAKRLAAHARACNFVWNYCCSIQQQAESRNRGDRRVRWPTAFDLIRLCTGAAKELGLHSDTVQTICRQFAGNRDSKGTCPRFRANQGSKRALGWLPFIPRAVQLNGSNLLYPRRKFRFWKHREIGGNFKSGCFAEDARGRWYVSFQCEIADDLPTGVGEVGIDLGLKDVAVLSTGERIENPRFVARHAQKLAIAQRAGRKRRARAITAKIANGRRHYLHVASKKIAESNKLICVGDVSISWQVKSGRGKSVLDAGWGMFRHMLSYKAARRRAACVAVCERWTTRTCSVCGADSGPKGIAGLGVRDWICPECGSQHDRDVNSARLILNLGADRRPPIDGKLPVKTGGGRYAAT